MASLAGTEEIKAGDDRKPRFLCLHGYQMSGDIMRSQVVDACWPDSVTCRLDLVFVDAPFETPVEGQFEWFQTTDNFSTYLNFEECVAYIEELMIKQGPFDGLMGFSQGGILSAALPGLQANGFALTRVPKVKYVIVISGVKVHPPELVAKAFSSKITCRSLHFIGEKDYVKVCGEELLEEFVDPLVIHHNEGHTIPHLDDKNLAVMLEYLETIEKDLHGDTITETDRHDEEHFN